LRVCDYWPFAVRVSCSLAGATSCWCDFLLVRVHVHSLVQTFMWCGHFS
jgi:hypothetical protein